MALDRQDPQIRAQQQAEHLLTFPASQRYTGYFLKALWGVLLGAGTIVGVAALVPTAHFIIIGALVVGAVGFGVKTFREIQKKHQEEKQALDELNAAINRNIDLLQDLNLQDIERLVGELQAAPGHFDEEEKEQVFARFCQLEKAVSTLRVFVEAKRNINPQDAQVLAFDRYYQQGQFQGQDLGEKIQSWKRAVYADPLRQPRALPILHTRPRRVERRGSWTNPSTAAKKLGNRVLDFAVGALAGVALGTGILSFAVGAAAAGVLLSNPVGWAMLGILAGAVAVGALSVAINYTVSRAQQTKINKITDKIEEFSVVERGLPDFNENMRNLADHREVKRAYRQLDEAHTTTSMLNARLHAQVEHTEKHVVELKEDIQHIERAQQSKEDELKQAAERIEQLEARAREAEMRAKELENKMEEMNTQKQKEHSHHGPGLFDHEG